MAVKPASTWSSNWSGSAGKATTNYTAGVDAYNGDWAAATTAQQATMQTNWLQSLADGSWANGVNSVGTSGWKSATVAKQANYGVGFQAGGQDLGGLRDGRGESFRHLFSCPAGARQRRTAAAFCSCL